MKQIDIKDNFNEEIDNLPWLNSARKYCLEEPGQIKMSMRINRSKFPCDFFSNLKEKKAIIKLRPLQLQSFREDEDETPKFRSYNTVVPKLLLSKCR
jgi:hypothetical protein